MKKHFKVMESFTAKTLEGELELRPGQVVRLAPTIAAKLLDTGKVKSYCYWQQETVEDCTYPCYSFDGPKKVSECHNFTAYWAERLKALEGKQLVKSLLMWSVRHSHTGVGVMPRQAR